MAHLIEAIKLVVLLVSSILFTIAIYFFNSDGTTWGSGPAFYGLLIMIPSAFIILKYSKLNIFNVSRWIIFFTALVGLIVTAYTFFNTKMKLSNLPLEDATQFYPPSLSYQLIGLFLILLIFYKSFKSYKGHNTQKT